MKHDNPKSNYSFGNLIDKTTVDLFEDNCKTLIEQTFGKIDNHKWRGIEATEYDRENNIVDSLKSWNDSLKEIIKITESDFLKGYYDEISLSDLSALSDSCGKIGKISDINSYKFFGIIGEISAYPRQFCDYIEFIKTKHNGLRLQESLFTDGVVGNHEVQHLILNSLNELISIGINDSCTFSKVLMAYKEIKDDILYIECAIRLIDRMKQNMSSDTFNIINSTKDCLRDVLFFLRFAKEYSEQKFDISNIHMPIEKVVYLFLESSSCGYNFDESNRSLLIKYFTFLSNDEILKFSSDNLINILQRGVDSYENVELYFKVFSSFYTQKTNTYEQESIEALKRISRTLWGIIKDIKPYILTCDLSLSEIKNAVLSDIECKNKKPTIDIGHFDFIFNKKEISISDFDDAQHYIKSLESSLELSKRVSNNNLAIHLLSLVASQDDLDSLLIMISEAPLRIESESILRNAFCVSGDVDFNDWISTDNELIKSVILKNNTALENPDHLISYIDYNYLKLEISNKLTEYFNENLSKSSFPHQNAVDFINHLICSDVCDIVNPIVFDDDYLQGVDLYHALSDFRNTMGVDLCSDEWRKKGILRDSMIEAFVKFMPTNRDEFTAKIPEYLRIAVGSNYGKALSEILDLIEDWKSANNFIE